MPSMANITVKKADGTTDIVYTQKQPSAGDGAAAVWRSDTIGSAISHQPELRLTAREAGKGAKRSLRTTYVYPQISTNTTTGVTSVVEKWMASSDVTMPKGMATADLLQATHQYLNLLASALIKQCHVDGVSAT